jgi:4-hydroxybenzoate polyprenyltransferase
LRGLRAALAHLRLYESTQVLVPGFFGILVGPVSPHWTLLALYGTAYWSHVLSVYSYNDVCDYQSDTANPRKAGSRARSAAWLRAQTLVLTTVFVACASFLPLRVALVFVVVQVICMAYSHPRICLKARPLGSEAAHFVAGLGYFASGVLIAGGDPTRHALGGVLFGLVYLSGGVFNEIMDWEADRRVNLRHLVVGIGRARALRLLLASHLTCFILLALYERSTPVTVASGVAASLLAASAQRLAHHLDDAGRLLQFRRRYRLIFGALLTFAAAPHVVHAMRAALQALS